MSERQSISIVVPTLNEEKNLPACLASIEMQDYPRAHIEVLVVDNCSEDSTVRIAREWGAKVLTSKIRDAERSKMIGMRESSGDLFIYLDADVELADFSVLSRLERALREDPETVGAFPRYWPKKSAPSFARHLRYHPCELDPVLDFLCLRPESAAVERRGDRIICDFNRERIPPVGICLYRRDVLLKVLCDCERFMDIDVPAILAEAGHPCFAYVPGAKIYHNSMTNLRELIARSRRNLREVFLPAFTERRFRYLKAGSKKDLLRVTALVFLANTPIYFVARGIWKSIIHRDLACMWEPVSAFVHVNTLILELLASKKGRDYIRHILR